jgi:hypothetical protein
MWSSHISHTFTISHWSSGLTVWFLSQGQRFMPWGCNPHFGTGILLLALSCYYNNNKYVTYRLQPRRFQWLDKKWGGGQWTDLLSYLQYMVQNQNTLSLLLKFLWLLHTRTPRVAKCPDTTLHCQVESWPGGGPLPRAVEARAPLVPAPSEKWGGCQGTSGLGHF